MPIQIGQKSAPTFQQPLELLSDCHRRVESFLRSLEIFPLAKTVLNSKTLSEVGREMAERRGQDFEGQSHLPRR